MPPWGSGRHPQPDQLPAEATSPSPSRRGLAQEMFNRRLRLRQMGRVEEFHEKWAAVCMNTRAQVLRVHALDDVDAASIAARAAPPERTVFTDGSKQQGGSRQQRALAASGPAGWAAVTVQSCPASGRRWVCHARAGRVVTLYKRRGVTSDID